MSDSLANPSSFEVPRGRPLEVVTIGSALMDQLAFVDGSVLAELGFTPGTMNLVSIAATKEIAARLQIAEEVSGGTTANTAVGVASLGGASAFVGAVSEDPLGERYELDLRAAGVATYLERLPLEVGDDPGTGRCVVMVGDDAERTFATALGVCGLLDHEAVAPALLATTSLVYFDAYVLDFPDADKLVARILEGAHGAGSIAAIGLADPLAVERHHEALRALLDRHAGILFANESEICALAGETDVAEAIGQLRRPGLVTYVTRGAKGAVVATEDGAVEIPAWPVDAVLDVTGAGDLFASGVMTGLARGLGLVEAARLGALAAGEIIGHLGARPVESLAGLAARAGLPLPAR